ncbi:MAG TPA: hypothetical protein VFI11_10550 [Anaerolineales bacterium]|nr:hypothetical protein [Anaerolineales bacterium]
MPRLTCWAIRLALIHLVLGFTLGGWLLCSKASSACAGAWPLLPLHVELLLLGWTAQLAMAVAYWILPRFAGGIRSRETAAWLSFVLLNLGVWLAGLTPALAGPREMIAAGRALEGMAAVSFAVHAWPRVKKFGT